MNTIKTVAIGIFSGLINLSFFLFSFGGLVICPKWGSGHLFANLWYAGASISGSIGWILLLNAYLGVGRHFDHRFKAKLTTDRDIDGEIADSILPSRLFIQSKVYRATLYSSALMIGSRWRKSPTIAALFEGFDFRAEASFLDWLCTWAFIIPLIGVLLMGLHSCLQWLK